MKQELDKNEILPFCTRCFGVGISHGEGNDNFCHVCGSQGTCVPMTRDYIRYLQENIDQRLNKPYTQADCIRDTKEHISQVRELMMIVTNNLTQRALVHDQSKLEQTEVAIFTEYTPKLKNSTYGSDEYKSFLIGMGEALKHHYEHNSHHPEHFKKHVCIICFKEYKDHPNKCEDCSNGYLTEETDYTRMNLLDIVEMFCDWKAATMRHTDGDLIKSIDINQKRFKISDDLTQIFRNTAKLF